MNAHEEMYKSTLESLSAKYSKLEDQRDQLRKALVELEKEFPIPACKEESEALDKARAALSATEENK